MKTKSGFALLLAIFLLMFISLLFIPMFDILTTDIQIADSLSKDIRALYIAEAGIEDVIYNLREDKDWTADKSRKEFPEKTNNFFEITYPVKGTEDRATSIAILSSGYRKTIEARIIASGDEAPYAITVYSWEEK